MQVKVALLLVSRPTYANGLIGPSFQDSLREDLEPNLRELSASQLLLPANVL